MGYDSGSCPMQRHPAAHVCPLPGWGTGAAVPEPPGDRPTDGTNDRFEFDPAAGLLRVRGDLDVVGGASLDRTLRDLGDVRALDLSDVEFVDSTGLRSLLAASRRCEAAGRRLVLVDPSAAVRRLLDITATADLFDVGGSAPDAG